MYIISASNNFKKQLKKIIRKDTALNKRVTRILKMLRKGVKHPSLKLHKLSGRNVWSISVTTSVRIIVAIKGNKIFLLEIGKHEDVY